MSLKRCYCVFAMKKVGFREIEGHRRGRRAPAFAEYLTAYGALGSNSSPDMGVGPRPRNLAIGEAREVLPGGDLRPEVPRINCH
jgi:hypothetical protein